MFPVVDGDNGKIRYFFWGLFRPKRGRIFFERNQKKPGLFCKSGDISQGVLLRGSDSTDQTVGFAEQGPLCSVKLPKQSTRRFGDTEWFFVFTAVCVIARCIEKCDNL